MHVPRGASHFNLQSENIKNSGCGYSLGSNEHSKLRVDTKISWVQEVTGSRRGVSCMALK